MKNEIFLDYEKGLSLRELSSKYKISRNLIRSILIEEGLNIRDSSESLSKKLSKKEIQLILNFHKEKVSYEEIAKILSIGRNLVIKTLRKEGIDAQPDEIFQLLQRYSNKIINDFKFGKSTKSIAEEYNVSSSSIRRFLKKRGVIVKQQNLNDIKEEVIDKYQKGRTITELGKEYNVTKQAISIFLKRHDIESRRALSVLEPHKKDIIDKYLEGNSCQIIADIYNSNSSSILNILKENNVERRSPEESKRIYSLDINFFDSIDSEEKAYFLGFLYADGNVSSTSNAIRLELKSSDRDILEKLNGAINSNNPLHDSNGMSCLRIHSKHMKESVIRLGLVPRKTHILTFPEWLNPPLYSHFIRGYFDGDGSISHNSITDTYTFSLAGTKEFLSRVQEILIKECNLNKVSITSAKTISILAYGGSKQLLRIRDFLYKDATIFLDRKKDIFDKIVVKENYLEDEKFKNAFEQFSTNKEIAENLDVSYKTVYRRLKDLEMERGRREVILDEKEAIRLYVDEKMTAGDIGKIFGTSHTTILKILRRNGVDIRDSHGSLKMERVLYPHKEEIIDLYTRQLKSAQHIANQFKVNQNTIIKFLNTLNIPMRGRNDTTKSVLDGKKEEVIKLLKESKKVHEIANHYSVTEAVVRKFFKRWGISSRSY